MREPTAEALLQPWTIDELRAALDDTWTSLVALCHELEPREWALDTGCPGWTVQDQMAHVAGLESVLSGTPAPEHELPGDLPHVRDELGRRMEILVDVRRGWPPEQVVAELEEVIATRREQLRGATADTTLPSVFGSGWPAVRSLPIRVVDCFAHEQDVRRATGRSGHLTGPAPEVATVQVLRGWAALMPQRNSTLVGNVIRVGCVDLGVAFDLDLTGDKGRLVEAGGVPEVGPRVVVTIGTEALMAHGGGRSDAGSYPVQIEGDVPLGQALLDAGGITP